MPTPKSETDHVKASTLRAIAAAAFFGSAGLAQAGPIIVAGNINAAELVGHIIGSGITLVDGSATLTFASPELEAVATGTFSNGLQAVGFAEGIVLTTGSIGCVAGPNNLPDCGLARSPTAEQDNTAIFDRTTLSFSFRSTAERISFRYVFASEEHPVVAPPTEFNDAFHALLNDVNIALLPDNAEISVSTINCVANAGLFRHNNVPGLPAVESCPSPLGLDIQFDGLTTVLTASATVVAGQTYSFALTIFDRGDNLNDSAVFVERNSFRAVTPAPLPPTPVPEPASLALAGLALVALAATRRRRRD
jgi:hypothetical protein